MGAGTKSLHKMTQSSKVNHNDVLDMESKNLYSFFIKVYIAEARLGFSSDTLDCVGSFVAQGPTDHISKASLLKALDSFKGDITQTPPL